MSVKKKFTRDFFENQLEIMCSNKYSYQSQSMDDDFDDIDELLWKTEKLISVNMLSSNSNDEIASSGVNYIQLINNYPIVDETEKYVDRRFSSQMIIREFFGIDYSYDDYDDYVDYDGFFECYYHLPKYTYYDELANKTRNISGFDIVDNNGKSYVKQISSKLYVTLGGNIIRQYGYNVEYDEYGSIAVAPSCDAINKQGKILLSLKNTDIILETDEKCFIALPSNYGYGMHFYDSAGKRISKIEYDINNSISVDAQGKYVINNKYVIDIRQNKISELEHDDIRRKYEKVLASVNNKVLGQNLLDLELCYVKNNKIDYVIEKLSFAESVLSMDFQARTECSYERICDENIIVKNSDGKRGMLNKSTLTYTVPCKYEMLTSFYVFYFEIGYRENLEGKKVKSANYAYFKDGKYHGYIDETGNEVVRVDASSYNTIIPSPCNHLFKVRKMRKYGYVDSYGKNVIDAVYSYVGFFYDGYALALMEYHGREFGDPPVPALAFDIHGNINKEKSEEFTKYYHDIAQARAFEDLKRSCME